MVGPSWSPLLVLPHPWGCSMWQWQCLSQSPSDTFSSVTSLPPGEARPDGFNYHLYPHESPTYFHTLDLCPDLQMYIPRFLLHSSTWITSGQLTLNTSNNGLLIMAVLWLLRVASKAMYTLCLIHPVMASTQGNTIIIIVLRYSIFVEVLNKYLLNKWTLW